MRIALVRPNIGRLEHSLFVDEARMEPLELAVLAGLIPPVTDADAGALRQRYDSSIGVAHPCTFPDRSIYGTRKYLPVTLLQFSRGCVNCCDYCATGAYSRGHAYHREVDRVIEEVATQHRRYLFFVDDNIVAHPKAAKELFRELAPLKLKWVSRAGIAMTGDTELMALMTRSGCLGPAIGFESLDVRNLESVSKRVNYEGASNGYRHEIEVLRDYGLQTWAAFTLGYDFDTKDSIRRTLDFRGVTQRGDKRS